MAISKNSRGGGGGGAEATSPTGLVRLWDTRVWFKTCELSLGLLRKRDTLVKQTTPKHAPGLLVGKALNLYYGAQGRSYKDKIVHFVHVCVFFSFYGASYGTFLTFNCERGSNCFGETSACRSVILFLSILVSKMVDGIGWNFHQRSNALNTIFYFNLSRCTNIWSQMKMKSILVCP